MLLPVTAPRPQLTTQAQQPRPKLVVSPARTQRRRELPARPHTFSWPEVREMPRRAAGGPWESGW
jgi:hypothetical protein